MSIGHEIHDEDPMSVDPYAHRELYIHLRGVWAMERAAKEYDAPGCKVCGAIDAKPCEACTGTPFADTKFEIKFLGSDDTEGGE